jgi:Uma2 family endonuclease
MTTTSQNTQMITLADWVAGPKQGEWTYSTYAALPDNGQRYEIVNGVLVMPPSPDGPHQDAALRIGHYLLVHVEFAGLGKVRISPADVELSPNNVYQPDVFVVLKEHMDRVRTKRVVGSPDLVIEVASPSTAVYDRLTKYETYERFGVPEYWIARDDARTIEVLVLENGKYRSLGVFSGQETLPSRIVPNLPVQVDQFFV